MSMIDLPDFPLGEEDDIAAIITQEDCPQCRLLRHCPILENARRGFFPVEWVRENWGGDMVATCVELTYLPSKWEQQVDENDDV